MPKIPLKELEAAAEYMTGKVPRYGMFSTLKGLIDNSPRDVMTAQEWGGYLKPGQIATRAGVEFPLKKEELDYAKIPDFLAAFKPNQKIGRDEILAHYMTEAPNLNADIGSKQAKAGQTREQQLLGQQEMSIEDRLKRLKGSRGPQYSEYSHAERGDSPGNAASPFGNDQYQLDITTSPDFGRFSSHWDGNDISWNRTNRLPLAGENLDYDPGNPRGMPRTMRVIDEIQSDRHQKAIKPGGWAPTPENLTRMQDLASDLMNKSIVEGQSPYGRNVILEALRYGPEQVSRAYGLATDPRWVELQQLREASKGKIGYRGPNEQQRLAQIEQDPMYRNPHDVINQNQQAYFDNTGNMNTRTDPEIQRRIDSLRQEHERLSNMVPDTPFKTTQGFVGLEMRKALADAVHSGDLGLGLSTGNDQNAFYGRRFSADQASGQNYNYNTSYPSVLKDLARRFQVPYRPMDVTLKAQPTTNPAWPPSAITRIVPDFGQPGEVGDLYGFVQTVSNLDRYSRYDRLRAYDRLWDEIRNKIPEEERTALGIRGVDPDTGEFIENPELAESKFKASIEDMRKYQREIENLNNKFPEYDPEGEGGHYDEEDNWVPEAPDPRRAQARQDMLRSQAWKNANFNYQQASNEAHEGLKPLYQWYEQKFGPQAINPEDLLRQKTFQNSMDFSDPGVADRIKAAGIPIWRHGGSVHEDQFDHISHALRHLGHESGFLTHNAIEQGFAGGGEVGFGSKLGQLISEFIEHMHNVNRLPPEQLTEGDVAKAHELGYQLTAQGIDPQQLISSVMARAGKAPGMPVTEHAEGGTISLDDTSNAPSSMETAVNWLKTHTPRHALLNPNAPLPTLPEDVSRITKAVMEPFYGQNAEGQIRFLGGGPELHLGPKGEASVTMGRPMLADEVQTMIEGANKLIHRFGDWLRPPEKNLSSLITGEKKEEPSEADTRLENLKAAIANRTGIGAPQNFKEFLEDQAGAVIPIPGLQEEQGAVAAGRGTKALGHILAQFGITPMEEYAHVAPVWAGGNAALGYAMDKLDKLKAAQHTGSQGQMSPEDAVNNARLTEQELDPTSTTDPSIPITKEDLRNPQDVVGEEQYQRYLRGDRDVDMMGSQGSSMADGGQPDTSWEAVKNRVHILQHPMIEGKPGPMPPPAEENEVPPLVDEEDLMPAEEEESPLGKARLSNADIQALMQNMGHEDRVSPDQEFQKELLTTRLQMLKEAASRGQLASGGQPQPDEPPPPSAPTEESLLNDMLQRRILMRQSAPPIPMPSGAAPLTMAGGGEIGFVERLMQLLGKLKGGAEHLMDPEAEYAHVQQQAQALHSAPHDLSDPDFQAKADAYHQRLLQLNEQLNPKPDMDYSSLVMQKDEGGPVQNPGTRKAKVPQGVRTPNQIPPWNIADIRRRLEVLRNPLISGPPPSSIPPMPHALGDEELEHQQALERIRNLMGHDPAMASGVESEDMGPMHFTSADSDILDMLRAKLMTSNPEKMKEFLQMPDAQRAADAMQKRGIVTVEGLEDETPDKPMRRGGHAKHHRAAGKVHGRVRSRG